MNQDQFSSSHPAPCIIDSGIVVNKKDIRRLLIDLGRVRYIHTLEGNLQSQGEGCVLDVFSDHQRSTLIANHALYLNVYSFDYLQLSQSPEQEAHFDLIQENRCLRLIPLSNSLQEQSPRNINAAALEAAVAHVLSAKWDVQLDEGDFLL